MTQVYKIKNKVTGRAYIGATGDDFDGRYHGGRWWAKTHNHELQDDAFRLGESAFEVEILQDNVSIDDLAEVEFDMISVHDTWYPNGYNVRRNKQNFKSKEDPEEKRKRLDKLKREHLRREFYERIAIEPFSVAASVRSFREILGKTQEEFAVFQDVAIRTLREIEQGGGNPTVETIQKLFRGSGLAVSISLERKLK